MGCGSSTDKVRVMVAPETAPETARASTYGGTASWRDDPMVKAPTVVKDTTPNDEGTWRDANGKLPKFRTLAKSVSAISSFFEADAAFPDFPEAQKAAADKANGLPTAKRKHLLTYEMGQIIEKTTAEFGTGLVPLPPYVAAGRTNADNTTIFKVYLEFPKPLVLATADYIVGGITPGLSDGNLTVLMAVRKLDDFWETQGTTTPTSRISKKGSEAIAAKKTTPSVRGLEEGVPTLRNAFSLSNTARILIAGARIDNIPRGSCSVCNLPVLQTQHRERQIDGTYRHAECISHDLVEEYL